MINRFSTYRSACAALILSSLPWLAGAQNLTGSDFEIDADANLIVDNGPPNLDWATVDFIQRADEPSGNNDDSFGQGTKEDTEIPSPVQGSIPPNKSDLQSFGVYQEANANGDFMHVFWSRVQDPEGTTNMDFEFNQSSEPSTNGITPFRTGGDKLVVYELSKGGTTPTIAVLTWLEDGDGTNCEASNSYPCWGNRDDLSGSGDATGSINLTEIPLTQTSVADPVDLGPFDPYTFGEASVNLAILFSNAVQDCITFGSAYLKSRSSDSFTAALKDYIAPLDITITNCGTVTISKTDDAGQPIQGATFALFNSNGDDIFEPETNDPPAIDPDGAQLQCTTDHTGTCAIDNVFHGEYWIDETAVPDGYVKSTELPAIINVTDTDPDLVLSYVNPRERGSILVKKVVKGTDNVLAGAEFKYDSNNDGQVDTLMGQISVGLFCVDNLLEGSYLVEETTVPSGYNGADPQMVVALVPSVCDNRHLVGTPDATFENEAITNLVTSANETVTVGELIHDTATLSDGYHPTGTILFELYDNAACTGTPVFSDTVEVDNGNGDYSTSHETSDVGTYYWLASYSGDVSNSSASHDCAVEGEVDTVIAAETTLTTTPNLLPNDEASISGGFGTLSGSITFELYSSVDCSGDSMYTETLPVTGAGLYETSNTDTFITEDGNYSWEVTFVSSDPNNVGSASACDEERYVIDITP